MKKTLLAALLLSASGLALAPLAHADLLATYSINGGATTTICSAANGGSCTATGSASDVTITDFTADANSPGSPTLAEVLSDTVSLTNSGTSAATIVLTVGSIDFTSPTTPPNLTLFSHVGGTVVVGSASNTLSFVSSIDQGDGQNVTPGTYNTAAVTPSITGEGSYDASDNLLIASLSSPYSMTEQFTIVLGAGSQINFSASTDLQPVPEPGSLALLGTALIGIGAVGWSRRRRA